LDFAKQNITDVGESGVQELASLGREHLDEDESSVHRYASMSAPTFGLCDILLQDRVGVQPLDHSANGIRVVVPFAISQPQE
jgi:hypothetical protein